jgi:hypothetical protein
MIRHLGHLTPRRGGGQGLRYSELGLRDTYLGCVMPCLRVALHGHEQRSSVQGSGSS